MKYYMDSEGRVWFDGGYSYLVKLGGELFIGSKDTSPRTIDLSWFSKDKARMIQTVAREAFDTAI